MLYERFDSLLKDAHENFMEGIRPAQITTHQGRFERDATAAYHSHRIARLAAAEHGLVIGRLDVDDEEDPFYIGRTTVYSEDYDPLLIDWRAPAATPFYRATPAEPLGVRRRRHIHLKGRDVVRLDDDILALDKLDDDERQHLTGEAALLSSLQSARTGRMGDIVATIQAEQDRVIRSELDGILVVEGGPGTGKTVVALHRAAYLLYTYRNQLSRNGVLVVGPNSTFVRYIDQVLPGLGETDVVLTAVGGLYPGVDTARVDPPDAAIVKGDLRMVDVLEQAVTSQQRAPIGGLRVETERDVYFLDDETCRRIRDNARERMERTGQPHNRMRRFVVREVLDELTRQALDRVDSLLDGVDVPEENDDEVDRELTELLDHDSLRRELRSSDAVREVLDVLWPELTPEGILSAFFTDPYLRADLAPQFSVAERDALHRDDGAAWTVADVPLLDELATLVGELDLTLARRAASRARATGERSRASELERELISDAYDVAMDMAIDEEVAMTVDAELVLSRYHDTDGTATVAERARQDREWTYGHVIVDEAQELSPMAWRLLGRRCPALSMTVVGDIAQTGSADGASSWAAALDPLAGGRWRRARLTVNYRTTEPIMSVAADVLAASGTDAVAPRSVRAEGDQPWSEQVPGVGASGGGASGDGVVSGGVSGDGMAEVVAEIVRRERDALGEGTLAVIVSSSLLAGVGAAVQAVLPSARTADDERMLDAPVAILTPEQAKGLEFDEALVVEPARILGESRRGYSDLYVALTRPTRRLGVVHVGALPPELSRLQPMSAVGEGSGSV